MCENFNKPNRKESKCDSARDLEFSSNMNKDDLYSDQRKDETKTRKDASETDVCCDYEYKPVIKEIAVKDKETRNHVHGNGIQPDETYCQNKETSVQSNTALIKGIRGDGVKRTEEENQDAVTEEETVQKKFVAATSCVSYTFSYCFSTVSIFIIIFYHKNDNQLVDLICKLRRNVMR